MAKRVTNETVVRVDWVTKDGKHDFDMIDEDRVPSFVEELTNDGATPEIKYTQTFGIHEVSEDSPLDDLGQIVPNVQEQANLINRALRIKEKKHIRDVMKQDNFTPVEGVYDLGDVAAAVSERKAASPEQKAANQISKLLGRTVSVEELAQILSAMGPSEVSA